MIVFSFGAVTITVFVTSTNQSKAFWVAQTSQMLYSLQDNDLYSLLLFGGNHFW